MPGGFQLFDLQNKCMNNRVIGIDISKDTLDFCVLSKNDAQVIDRGVIKNQIQSIKKWLKSFTLKQAVFALEHTGHYGASLIDSLSERGFIFYVLNPLDVKRSLGVQRGKSDEIDAYRIAEYAMTRSYKLIPYKLPSDNLIKLKALITGREGHIKMSVQLQNSIKANEILSKTTDMRVLIKEQKKILKATKQSITALEKEMQAIIASDEALKKSYKKVTKVIGVGPIIAIKCITETDNFTKFDDARKFSCHCGLAPFPFQSGSSVKGRTKTHHLRDKSLKAILIKGAVTAINYDPQLRAYYIRKVKEGKHKMSVINAVANKLVLRIFAVALRDEPFVKMAA